MDGDYQKPEKATWQVECEVGFSLFDWTAHVELLIRSVSG